MVPRSFRLALEARQEASLFLTYALGKPLRLEARPAKAFRAYQERFTRITKKSPDLERFALFYFGSAVEVEVDRAGRLLVPAELRKRVGLRGDAAFVGIDADRFQIWRPEDLDQVHDAVLGRADEILNELGDALGSVP